MLRIVVALCGVVVSWGRTTFVPVQVVRRPLTSGPPAATPDGPLPLSLAEATSSLIPVTLYDLHKMAYIAEVVLGGTKNSTNPAPVRLIVDTGSSDMWVMAETEVRYNHTPEALLLPPSETVQIQYGQGAIEGLVVADSVCFPGSFCIDRMPMIVATDVAGVGASMTTFDGLLGLGFPALEKLQGAQSFLTVLAYSSWFHKSLAFGLALRGLAYERKVDTQSANSYIVFGDLDEVISDAKRETGQSSGATVPVVQIPALERLGPFAVKVRKPYWWLIRFAVAVDGAKVEHQIGALDSGTSVITAPGSVYEDVLGNLTKGLDLKDKCATFGVGAPKAMEGKTVCECGTRLNPIIFTFSDSKGGAPLDITLTSDDILVPVTPKYCFLGIMASPKNASFWLLGDILLSRVYAVHDYHGEQIVLFGRKSEKGIEHMPTFRGSKAAALSIETPRLQGAAAVLVMLGFAIVAGGYSWRRSRTVIISNDGYARL